MLVVDANDVGGASYRDLERIGPVVHPAIDNLIEGLAERSDIEVFVLYGKRNPGSDEMREHGSVRYVPVSYRSAPIPGIGGAYFGRVIALRRALKKLNPDIVHAQGTERESGLVAAISRYPSLLTLHGNFRELARVMGCKPMDYLWINSKLETWICRRVDAIVAISSYTKRLVESLNRTVWVLPNAVASHFFDISNQSNEGRVVCIAGIGLRKNQREFLVACDRVAQKNSEFRLEFWGPAEKGDSYFEGLLEELAQRPWADYHGSVSPQEIPDVLRTADLLVLPSKEDNCPVVILEAMAAGIPVVASDVGGIPDLVEDGKTGLLAPSNEIAAQAQAVESLLGCRDRRAAMALESRRLALARFAPEAIAAKHLEFYRAVLESS